MLPIRTILHPADFSEHSRNAFRLACSLARDHGVKLLILHGGEAPVIVTRGAMTPPPPFPEEYDRPALEAKLRDLKPSDASIQVEYRLVYGPPALQILDTAKASQMRTVASPPPVAIR